MALKSLLGKEGCIAKAGKALDVDDKKYLMDLLHNSVKSEEEVLNSLEGLIISEQRDAIKLIEAKGLTVERAALVSEENLAARSVAEPEGRAEELHAKVSDENKTAVETTQSPGSSLNSGAVDSTKSNTKAPGDGSLKHGPRGDPAVIRSIQSKKRPGGLFLTRESYSEAIDKLSAASPIIARFLDGKTGKIFLDAFTDSFLADEDVINITGTDISTKGNKGRALDLNNPADFETQKEILEHEIVHANTTAYLIKNITSKKDTAAGRDILYLDKAVKELINTLDTDFTEEALERVKYILSQEDGATSIAEFVAVMGAETDVAAQITAVLGRRQATYKNSLKGRIEGFVKRVKEWFDGVPDSDLNSELDIDKLNAALTRTLDQGLEFREQQYEETKKYTNGLVLGFNEKTPLHFANKASFDYLNHAVATMLNSRLERQGKKIIGNLHNILLELFPMYVDVAEKAIGIYNGSPALQEFLHTVTGEGVDKVKKANTLSKFAAINAQRTEIINDNISRLTVLSKDLKPKEKADLNAFITQMPLHDYFLLADELKTAESIEAEAELLRKKLWKLNSRAVRDVDQLIDWNVGILDHETGKMKQTLTGRIYNLDTKSYPQGGEFGESLRKLLALESIKRIGSEKFEKLLRNEELIAVIKDNSLANGYATISNEGKANIRDSFIMDYWKEPFHIQAVTENDFRNYTNGEETGWKVLKSPTRTELGVVYKPTIDSTDIAGAYTDIKLSSPDIIVPTSMRKFRGVVETKNGYKLLLNREQKQELGLIEGFEQSLVRSAAHSISIQESEIIRNELLKEETWMEIGKEKTIKKLIGIIESDNIDNPWFLKLDEGTLYNKLPPEIRNKYMEVGNRASNVKGFNESVDLVRKDISHWLLGGSAKALFDNPQFKWAVRILKGLITGAKIGMVVLNPIKIANDNLSNLTYLSVRGVNPLFTARNYKDIFTAFAEYSELQRQIFQLKLQLVSRPDSTKVKKSLKNLQKRLAKNSIGDIGDKGFINSLGSDLVSRSADTLSGFQADMHTSLEYLLTNKAGNKNLVSHFVMQVQNIGFQAESFFSYLGDIAGRAESTKLLQQELDQVADRLREIKSDDDVINYVSQFTTSPSSEAVRFGSAMTDLTDVLAKETLYRHLTQNRGMDPGEARIEVLDSFPDYKENMPLAVKQLSDAGIIMFPSFWLRIQKIIYRMARDNPTNLATELMLQEWLGSNVNTIFEANIINKSETYGGLLHTPFEPIGFGSVVPMEIFA